MDAVQVIRYVEANRHTEQQAGWCSSNTIREPQVSHLGQVIRLSTLNLIVIVLSLSRWMMRQYF